MADASRLKQFRRIGLGAPPPLEEARNFTPPDPPAASQTETKPPTVVVPDSPPMPDTAGEGRIDGRSMRRSGRTVQFATRVSPEFDARIRRIAQRDKLLLVEVLERALDAYDRTRG